MTGFYEGTGGAVEPVPHDLDFHDDVYINAPTDGQILVYNATTGNWENKNDTAGSVGLNFDDLLDVDVAVATDGQAVVYQAGSGNWVPATLSGTGAVLDLNGLTDVTITSATNGDRLQYDGGQWINTASSTAASNPITVGTGTDNTDATVILKAGTVVDTDYSTIRFDYGNTPAYEVRTAKVGSNTAPSFAILPSGASTPAIRVNNVGLVSINGNPFSPDYEFSVNGDVSMVNLLCSDILADQITGTDLFVNLSGIGSANYKFDVFTFGSNTVGRLSPSQNASDFTVQARSSGGTNYDMTVSSTGALIFRGITIADGSGVSAVQLSGNQTISGEKTFNSTMKFPATFAPMQFSGLATGANQYLRIGTTGIVFGSTTLLAQDVVTASGDPIIGKVRAALLQIADILGANPQKMQDIEDVLDAMEIL